MPRRLVVQVPDVECVRCKATAPASVNFIDGSQGNGAMRARLVPPKGWALLSPERQTASAEGEPRAHRSFLICGNCYSVGQPIEGTSVDALYEARDR